MLDLPITPATTLSGAFSLEAGLATVPPGATVRGMFFRHFSDLLGPDYEQVGRALEAPVKHGKYVAFREYPQRDYARVVVAAAQKRFPALSLREAMRQIAREDLKIFAESMIGRVVLAVAGDARSTLLRVPDAYKTMAPSAPATAVDLDPRTIRVLFDPHTGWIEYTLGQLEGIVLAFKGSPVTTVHAVSNRGFAFDVVHTH